MIRITKYRQIGIYLCVFTLSLEVGISQTSINQRQWIFLHKKEIQSTQTIDPVSLGITERSIKRRAKTLPPDRLIDEYDIPIAQSILTQIESSGAKIRTASRWLNAISVEATQQQLQCIASMPEVKALSSVIVLRRSEPIPQSAGKIFHKSAGTGRLEYGLSATQLTNMKVIDLHSLGINGQGVLIGILDDGFNNYRTHIAFQNIKIDSTYDFIHNISDVNRQSWEDTISRMQGNHGAGTLSEIGGFTNGQFIGAAYGASFLLAKTEMDSSGNVADFHSEEDTYVAGLEWAERLGADITSSSLGYIDFSPHPTYSQADLNGRTTLVAQAAAIAARKGVLVVTAAGNDGGVSSGIHRTSTLVSPADADSILAVGATTSDGELAYWSGCGPTADNRIKPDIVAQGTKIYWANGATTNGFSEAQGTSCSTPLVAGAAALVLSAHPELTNMQLREALLQTTIRMNDGTVHTSSYPNNFYGYGFVNALDAALFCGTFFSNSLLVIKSDSAYSISIWIRQEPDVRLDQVYLHYKRPMDSIYQQIQFTPARTTNEYIVKIPESYIDSTMVGYVTAIDQTGNTRRSKSSLPSGLFSLATTADSLLKYFPNQSGPVVPTEYILFQNFPNPFNGFTNILFEVPKGSNVELDIFNILGQRVKTIFKGEVLVGGSKTWDGTNDHGNNVASGVYFARLKTPSSVHSIKMLYMK